MCGGEQQQGGGEEAAGEAGQDHRGGAQQVGHQHPGEPADTSLLHHLTGAAYCCQPSQQETAEVDCGQYCGLNNNAFCLRH